MPEPIGPDRLSGRVEDAHELALGGRDRRLDGGGSGPGGGLGREDLDRAVRRLLECPSDTRIDRSIVASDDDDRHERSVDDGRHRHPRPEPAGEGSLLAGQRSQPLAGRDGPDPPQSRACLAPGDGQHVRAPGGRRRAGRRKRSSGPPRPPSRAGARGRPVRDPRLARERVVDEPEDRCGELGRVPGS